MHPELKRKYGKSDFQRFDHLSPLHASFGGGEIGKVKVDCRFRFEKSQWGVLGPTQNPAGIIYLDLDFHQPVDCRLKSATVTVILDDADDDGPEPSVSTTRDSAFTIPVQLTPWFGPQQLSGQSRYKLKTKRNQMTPHIEAMGIVGAGGIGRDSDETFVQESRWNFSGRLLSGKGSWAYKKVRWELTENDFELQPIHNNIMHTAFSFQHEGQPFLMRVEVSGKLRSMNDRVKHKIKKFSSSIMKDRGCATTLINFGGPDKFTKPLDELARGLKAAMEMENLIDGSVLVPNVQKVTFQEDASAVGSSTAIDSLSDYQEAERLAMNTVTGLAQPALGEAPLNFAHLLGEEDADEATTDSVAPTIANLAGAFAGLTSPQSAYLSSGAPTTSSTQVGSEVNDASKVSLSADQDREVHEVRRRHLASKKSRTRNYQAHGRT